MKYDVFISYSSKNMETALAICHVLESNNIRCWMAPRNIPAGADYGDVIDVAITECKVFLLLYSEPATISPWVKGELNLAFTEGKHIIPYRIDQTPLKGAMKLMLNQRHWIDAHPDANDEFRSLVDSILPIVGAVNINLKKDADTTKISKSTTKTQGNIVGNTDSLDFPINDGESVEKGAIIHVKPDMDCCVMKFGEEIGLFEAGKFNDLRLAKGRYILNFISLEHPEDQVEITYEVKDNNSEDFIMVELRKVRDQRLKEIARKAEEDRKREARRKKDEADKEALKRARKSDPQTGNTQTTFKQSEVKREVRTIRYSSGDTYVGEVNSNGERHGMGVYTWANGDKYEGGFVKGDFHGKGVFTWANGNKYEGDYVEDKRHGKGVFTWADGDKYVGDFVEGKLHGKGVYTWANGDKYEGDYVDDKRHGKGVYTYANGDKYEGDYVEDKRHGKGVFTWANGRREAQEYKNGNKQTVTHSTTHNTGLQLNHQ